MLYGSKPEVLESQNPPEPADVEALLERIRAALTDGLPWRCCILEGDLGTFGNDIEGLMTITIDVPGYCHRCESYHHAEEGHVLLPGQPLKAVRGA